MGKEKKGEREGEGEEAGMPLMVQHFFRSLFDTPIHLFQNSFSYHQTYLPKIHKNK